jgi:hypothetical protein
MLVPPAALERAVTIREVVLRAMSGAISWTQPPSVLWGRVFGDVPTERRLGGQNPQGREAS